MPPDVEGGRDLAAFSVEPRRPRVDEVVRLSLIGLNPGTTVTLTADTSPFDARATASFIANEDGCIDLTRDAPIGGDYSTVDAMGLFWSASLPDGVGAGVVYEAANRLEPVVTTVTASVEGSEVTRTVIERLTLPDGVTRASIRHGRLRGTFFHPNDGEPRPAVIVLGGSEGGNRELRAALLAARGFATLSLAYFAFDDLPASPTEIPLEYFDEALTWLQAQPEVNGRIGVVGQSVGGELALLLGATFPDITAVVAAVPSPVLWAVPTADGSGLTSSWTRQGAPLPTAPPPAYDEHAAEALAAAMAAAATGGAIVRTDAPVAFASACLAVMRDISRDHPGVVPVERTSGAMLLISGTDDLMWPSVELADLAIARLQAHEFPHHYEHVAYLGAGHSAAQPPHFPTTLNWVVHQQVPLAMAIGGSPRATAEAQADAAERIATFLAAHLADGDLRG